MKQNRIFSFVALAAFLFCPLCSRAQGSLTVYDNPSAQVTNHYVPAYIHYWDDFTRSQYVIPSGMLTTMRDSTISALTFYTTSTNVPYTSASVCDVYLKEVSSPSLSNYVAKSTATVVYSGTVSIESAGDGGTMTITFTTPYTYNGGNLLIGIENTTDAGYKQIHFRGQNVTGASGAGSNASSLEDVPFIQQDFIPKTTFTLGSVSGGSTPEGLMIGDPNSNASSFSMPVNTYYNYSLTETIIDANEIGGPMTIGSISYKYDYTTPMTSSKYGIKIWLKPTTRTVFSSETDMEFVDNTATLVYDGPIACSEGWNEITFTTPYSYSGSGNLMVIVRDTVDGFDGDDYTFVVSSCTGNKTLSWMSDIQIPDITALSTAEANRTINYRPLMILGGRSVDCSAALDLPFTCGFETTDNLGCWSFTDADGDGNGWLDNVAMDVAHDTYNFYTPVFHSGTGCYMSDSYNHVPLTPDNWMVTPKLHIPSNGATLEWWDYATYEEDYAEHYSVLVSTTGTEISDFTGNVFETTLTQGVTWVQRVVSLADYAGQDVYIAFRHYNCTDQLALAIDDISVTATTQGIDDVSTSLVKVNPNPATDVVTVSAEGLREVSLLDLNGRVLGTTASARVDVSGLAAGVYFLRVVTAAGVATEKLVKE